MATLAVLEMRLPSEGRDSVCSRALRGEARQSRAAGGTPVPESRRLSASVPTVHPQLLRRRSRARVGGGVRVLGRCRSLCRRQCLHSPRRASGGPAGFVMLRSARKRVELRSNQLPRKGYSNPLYAACAPKLRVGGSTWGINSGDQLGASCGAGVRSPKWHRRSDREDCDRAVRPSPRRALASSRPFLVSTTRIGASAWARLPGDRGGSAVGR